MRFTALIMIFVPLLLQMAHAAGTGVNAGTDGFYVPQSNKPAGFADREGNTGDASMKLIGVLIAIVSALTFVNAAGSGANQGEEGVFYVPRPIRNGADAVENGPEPMEDLPPYILKAPVGASR
ncbi:hypothetical protein BDR26DRAFT_1011318 [Obelidium mucronatum]|nr:hypothetical protein BDR26DRAFT_1011318 [Obelidium mucronatum]